MTICARCDQPIRWDEEQESHDVPAASGPGITIITHARLCTRPPRQTAPSGFGT